MRRLKKTNLFVLISFTRALLKILEKSFFSGFSKMSRCKAPEIQKSEAYLVYAATMKDEGNAADGRS